MNASRTQSRFRQQGMVTVLAVIFLITGVIFVLSQTLEITGSNSIDNSRQIGSTAALFLAESGVERAQAILRTGTCTGLNGTSLTLGEGTFSYTDAVVSVGMDDVSSCLVTVAGTVRGTSRSIRINIGITTTQGVAGFGNTFALDLQTRQANSGAFTNLAYRAKASGGGGNASVGNCDNTVPGSIAASACTNLWSLVGTGAGNVSGAGVYADVPTIGTYTIEYLLSAERHYSLTGILLNPTGSGVVRVGSYAKKNDTTSTSGTSGNVPTTWNCAMPTQSDGSGGTDSDSRAAGANTLVYGFSSLVVSGTGQLNNVSFGPTNLTIPQLYMRQIVTLAGAADPTLNDKMLYSQIWATTNAAYYSTGATAATNGANFTGAVGGVVTGCIGNSTSCNGSTPTCNGNGTTLRVCVAPTSGALRKTDTISGNAITNLTTITGFGTGTGGIGTYTVNTSQNSSNTTITAASKVLRVSAVSGVLTNPAIITQGIPNNPTLSYTTLTITGAAAGTGAIGDYLLSESQQTLSGGAAINTMQSAGDGTTITLSGTVTGGVPSVGTAIAVPLGNGVFDSAALTGSISGTTLTVSNCSNGTPSVGDALFGRNVRADTRITGPLSGGTACAGTYPVACPISPINTCPNQTAASNFIVARAAVLDTPAPLANSYKVSRIPTTRLSGNAQICGGVCAFFFGNAGPQTNFNLFNVASGPDWASGFACMSGVDPTRIRVLGVNVSRLLNWSEPAQ